MTWQVKLLPPWKPLKSGENHRRRIVGGLWAPWCAPCKLMNPEIEKLAEDMKDKVTVISVDVDVLKEVALFRVYLP